VDRAEAKLIHEAGHAVLAMVHDLPLTLADAIDGFCEFGEPACLLRGFGWMEANLAGTAAERCCGYPEAELNVIDYHAALRAALDVSDPTHPRALEAMSDLENQHCLVHAETFYAAFGSGVEKAMVDAGPVFAVLCDMLARYGRCPAEQLAAAVAIDSEARYSLTMARRAARERAKAAKVLPAALARESEALALAACEKELAERAAAIRKARGLG